MYNMNAQVQNVDIKNIWGLSSWKKIEQYKKKCVYTYIYIYNMNSQMQDVDVKYMGAQYLKIE